jgi:hypothetical protein
MQQESQTTTATTTGRAKRPPPTSAREIAVQVLREFPSGTSSIEAQCHRFDELISKHPLAQTDANTRQFITLRRDIEATATKAARDEGRARRAVEREAREQAIRAEVDRTVDYLKTHLLELGMSNGKPLGDCLGSEVAEFGRGFARIAERVAPDQKVGDVMTNADLAAMLLVGA